MPSEEKLRKSCEKEKGWVDTQTPALGEGEARSWQGMVLEAPLESGR